MRIGSEVRVCTASSPCAKKERSFYRLIHVIEIFMKEFFVVQHYPRNTFNIELFPNYGIQQMHR